MSGISRSRLCRGFIFFSHFHECHEARRVLLCLLCCRNLPLSLQEISIKSEYLPEFYFPIRLYSQSFLFTRKMSCVLFGEFNKRSTESAVRKLAVSCCHTLHPSLLDVLRHSVEHSAGSSRKIEEEREDNTQIWKSSSC